MHPFRIHPHLHEKLVETLRTTFFCLNIDESSVNKATQLDINCSFPRGDQIVKEHLTSISMEEGTKAEDIDHAIFAYLDSHLIPVLNMIDLTTDGCHTMIGEVGGLHALMRQRIPHLPHWGGCSCHDCSNILKAGVSKLDPNITELYSRLYTYLSSGSLHRYKSEIYHLKYYISIIYHFLSKEETVRGVLPSKRLRASYNSQVF